MFCDAFVMMDYTYSTGLYDYRDYISVDQYPRSTVDELRERHLKMYVCVHYTFFMTE